jgi:hypothetical protein
MSYRVASLQDINRGFRAVGIGCKVKASNYPGLPPVPWRQGLAGKRWQLFPSINLAIAMTCNHDWVTTTRIPEPVRGPGHLAGAPSPAPELPQKCHCCGAERRPLHPERTNAFQSSVLRPCDVPPSDAASAGSSVGGEPATRGPNDSCPAATILADLCRFLRTRHLETKSSGRDGELRNISCSDPESNADSPMLRHTAVRNVSFFSRPLSKLSSKS